MRFLSLDKQEHRHTRQVRIVVHMFGKGSLCVGGFARDVYAMVKPRSTTQLAHCTDLSPSWQTGLKWSALHTLKGTITLKEKPHEHTTVCGAPVANLGSVCVEVARQGNTSTHEACAQRRSPSAAQLNMVRILRFLSETDKGERLRDRGPLEHKCVQIVHDLQEPVRFNFLCVSSSTLHARSDSLCVTKDFPQQAMQSRSTASTSATVALKRCGRWTLPITSCDSVNSRIDRSRCEKRREARY